MSQQPTMPGASASPRPSRARAGPASRKPAATARKAKAIAKPADGLSRGVLAGRIAAGAAIGSAAIAGALLFAGKVDSKTPKRVWDKVKQPGKAKKRPAPKKAS